MLYTIFLFILGLCIGSFLNVVIFRLAKKTRKKKWWSGRSFCFHCKHQLVWHDLVPIFSFLFLRGKCRYCKKEIHWQYPAVELATGVLFVLLWYYASPLGQNWQVWAGLLRDLIAVSLLIVIFVVDWKHYLIFDEVTLPGIAVVMGLQLLVTPVIKWKFLLLGFAIGGLFFLLQFLFSRGRWIGGGDVRLGFLLGAILGWPKILIAIFLAYLSGAVLSLILVGLKKKDFKSQMPFGTFLAAATIIAILWGDMIWRWYW